MVLFPRIGGTYWIVIDIWETFVAVPVTITAKGGLFKYTNGGKGLFTVKWQITSPKSETGSEYGLEEGYAEEYDASRRELYKTHRQAARVAAKFNKEAGKE